MKPLFAGRLLFVLVLVALLTVSGTVPAAAKPRRTTQLSARFNNSSVRVGVTATLSGALSPTLFQRPIYLQRYDQGRWRSLTNQRTTRAGRVAFAVRAARAGTFRYRLRYGGDSGTKPSVTTARTLAVLAAASVNSSGLLGGNINPIPPVGAFGKLTVVQHGQLNVDILGGGALPVIIRNNTASTRTGNEITALVRDSAGRLVATGTGDRSVPDSLASGGVGLAEVDFEHPDAIPAGATYTFTVGSRGPSALGNVTLDVTETNHVGDAIVGYATNTTGHKAFGPYLVQVFCFAGTAVNSTMFTYAAQNAATPNGGIVAFTADLNGLSCATYLVGVTGWNF